MLDDLPRTEAYQKAILSNKDYFKEKIVMDVGCGTGILSIFCAQAGAKKVYAIEASNLASLAKEVVKENDFGDVIEVIHSRVEDVVLPGDVKVDAIVSEWMGFYLLHEGMLDSVLIARDKFLKEGGEIFPSSATIYMAPCRVPALHSKWDSIYGVTMTAFGKHLRAEKCQKPEILNIEPGDLLAPTKEFYSMDLKEINLSELASISSQYLAGADRQDAFQGICIWFDCHFRDIESNKELTILSTGPESLLTHWKQTVIVLPEEQQLEKSEPIAFQLDMIRDQTHRRYNLELTMLDPELLEHPIPCSCYMTKCILIKTLMMQAEQGQEFETNSDCLEEHSISDNDE